MLVQDRDGSGTVSAGDRVGYQVELGNTGSAVAGQVEIRVPIPAYTAFAVGSVAGGGVVESSLAGGVLSVWLEDLPAGGVGAFTWAVDVADRLPEGLGGFETQGSLAALGVAAVSSDDPDTAVIGDPTVTPLDSGGSREGAPIPTLSVLGLVLLGLVLALWVWRVLA